MRLHRLPEGFGALPGASQIRVCEAPPDLEGEPFGGPCPVCGITPVEQERVPVILELTYSNRRVESMLITAHRRCLK